MLFYKPEDGWLGDCIPFFWEGEYHIFYLKDYRDPERHGEGMPWFHIGTRDFVTYTDYGEALPRGTRDDQDLGVYTGCVVEHDGLFHIFYTGDNRYFRAHGTPVEAIMHATSPDLIHWIKDPLTCVVADASRYEVHDWRDPFVFWNEEAGEYWMLVAARLKQGPVHRRGCVALVVSHDLQTWEVRDPFWAPGLDEIPECPEVFHCGGWWYLIYSTSSERTLTHYRMSRSLTGPWRALVTDAFDSQAYYAAKTASDGHRRFAFGWTPTRQGDDDTGVWQWGGNLVVHEVVADVDGALHVRVPPEVTQPFTTAIPLQPEPQMGEWDVTGGGALSVRVDDGFAWCRLAEMPAACYLETLLTCTPETRGCGVILRADDTLDAYYALRWEPERNRIVFDHWPRPSGWPRPGDQPFMLECPVIVPPGAPIRLQVLVKGSMIVTYVNDQIALSTRGYDHTAGACGVFVSEGAASFAATRLLVQHPE